MIPSELDIDRPDLLVAYLRGTGRIGLDEPVEIHRLAGGVSNRTVLVRRPDGAAWVIKQALPKLRVETDWFSDPARIHREAAGLRWLARIAPEAITPFVFEDFDHHLLAMAAVSQPHENWKTLLLAGSVDLRCVEKFAALLACIHDHGCDQAEVLGHEFADRSFFESLRLEPYYEYSAGQVTRVSPFLRELIRDCRARRCTLVHGDYSPKNILVHDGRLILLDHEVIHFGDGTFDVGFAMAHLLSKAHHLPPHRAAFANAAHRFWQVYRQGVSGTSVAADLEPMAARHTLGCLLARAVGRSPLEYLSRDERDQQAQVIADLMACPLTGMADLIDEFTRRL